jgi:hypothetical protein
MPASVGTPTTGEMPASVGTPTTGEMPASVGTPTTEEMPASVGTRTTVVAHQQQQYSIREMSTKVRNLSFTQKKLEGKMESLP